MSPFFVVFVISSFLCVSQVLKNRVHQPSTHSKDPKSTFRAAVYEHAVHLTNIADTIKTRAMALDYMMLNLNEYKRQTEIAAAQNADIIVFPEYGIHGFAMTRENIYPYLEYMADPEKESWNPCDDPQRYPDTEVQRFLSCLAKNNSIYLVANHGDRQPCNRSEDLKCPRDGRYQFNTNIAYDRNGLLIAKYHKVNLYFERQFDFPPVSKAVTFTTPFGVFGMITCFDILFRDPVIDMITKQGIRNIAFPTAWMDALPFLASTQFHSGFAAGLKLNFLAANINYPARRFHGSGIYTPDGPKAFYYNDGLPAGKLLVEDVDILTQGSNEVNAHTWTSEHITPNSTFQNIVWHDTYNLALLDDFEGHLTVCHHNICCELSYSRNSTDELYAFGAFDGLHGKNGRYFIYMQVCTLLKCKRNTRESCGERTKLANTIFTHVHIRGHNFTQPYVYPEALLTRNGSLALSRQWKSDNGTLSAQNGFEAPLLEAGLFARYYSSLDENGGKFWYHP